MLLNPETNTCETIQTHMTALLDNELLPADTAAIRSHISVCTLCADTLQQIQETLKTADTWNVEGSAILQRVESHLASEPKPVAGRFPQGTQRLSELLQTKRVITAEQFADARYVQRDTGGDIGRILVDLGYAGERDVIEAKAQANGIPFIDLTKHKPERSALSSLPRSFALKHNALPVKKDGHKLWVAMLDPQDVAIVDEIRLVTRCQVAPLLAVPSDLEQAIVDAYYTKTPNPNSAEAETADGRSQGKDDLRAVLNEMRALRTEIQELRGEVGSLRRLLSVTQHAAATKPYRPLPPPQMMPMPLPENGGLGLL